MNKYLSPIVASIFVLAACGPNLTGIEKEANELLKSTINSKSTHEKWVIETSNTVYKSDSLCILHVNTIHNNVLLGEVKEYSELIYYKNDGNIYYSFTDSDKDSIFVNEEIMKQVQQSTIYRKENYDNAMLTRSIIFLNQSGTNFTNQENKPQIPLPTNTGSWYIEQRKNEFGELIDEYIICLDGTGKYSKKDSYGDLTALLWEIQDDVPQILLYERGYRKVITYDFLSIFVLEENGTETEIKAIGCDDGRIIPLEESRDTFKEILKRGGILEFNYVFGLDKYKFQFDVTGYQNAYRIAGN